MGWDSLPPFSMRILSEYKFNNNKAMQVVLFTKREAKRKGMPDCDRLAIKLIYPDDTTLVGIRPDEILILISLLGEGMFKAIEAFRIGHLKGYNGFRK